MSRKWCQSSFDFLRANWPDSTGFESQTLIITYLADEYFKPQTCMVARLSDPEYVLPLDGTEEVLQDLTKDL